MTNPAQALLRANRQVLRDAHLKRWLLVRQEALREQVLRPIQGGAQFPLECDNERTADGVIVRARGEIDLSTIPILEAALRSALENGQHLIVDLTAVRYIDSTGLHTLLRSEEQLRAKRLKMVVVVPPSALIRRVLKISAIDKVIHLVPTLDEAVHSLRPDQSASPPST